MSFFSFQYPHDAPVDEAFEGFDNVDVNSSCKPQTIANVPLDQFHLTSEAKDLLRRLLEDDPKYRLKSIIALKRVAFFHNFNFDDVNHRKVSCEPRNFIKKPVHVYVPSMKHSKQVLHHQYAHQLLTLK